MKIVNRFMLFGLLTVVGMNLMMGLFPYMLAGTVWAVLTLIMVFLFTTCCANKMVANLMKMIDY